VISRALRIAIQIAIVIADSSRDESSRLVTSRLVSRSSRDDHEMIFVVPNYISPKGLFSGQGPQLPGMTIASFVLAIVAICIGVAALIMSIINTVRITRMNRQIINRSDGSTPVVNPSTTTSSSNNLSAQRTISIKPPYYACIFTSVQNKSVPTALDGYSTLAKEMEELAKQQNGYLGIDSSPGITISYWKSSDSMREWKEQVDHRAAQLLGKGRFYNDYHVHIAKVEREYALKKQQ